MISLTSGVCCCLWKVWGKSSRNSFTVHLTFLWTVCPGVLQLVHDTSIDFYLSWTLLCFLQLNTHGFNQLGRLLFWVIVFWGLPLFYSLFVCSLGFYCSFLFFWTPIQHMLDLIILFSESFVFSWMGPSLMSLYLCFIFCVIYFLYLFLIYFPVHSLSL